MMSRQWRGQFIGGEPMTKTALSVEAVEAARQEFLAKQSPKDEALQDKLELNPGQTQLLFAVLAVLDGPTGRQIPDLNTTTAQTLKAKPHYHITGMLKKGFFVREGVGRYSITDHAMKIVASINADKPAPETKDDPAVAKPKKKRRSKKKLIARKSTRKSSVRKRAVSVVSSPEAPVTESEAAPPTILTIAEALQRASLSDVTLHIKRRLVSINDEIDEIRRTSGEQIAALEAERDGFMIELRGLVGELTVTTEPEQQTEDA